MENMPLNPDQIRVDLLRIKRKLYISYPEGSKERREFLLATKMAELNHLQKMIAPDLVDMVFTEYDRQQKAEVTKMSLWIIGGACFSAMLFAYHRLYPQSIWLEALYPMPTLIGLITGSTHLFHAAKHWQSFQPFKLEYEKIVKKVAKILKEINDLASKK